MREWRVAVKLAFALLVAALALTLGAAPGHAEGSAATGEDIFNQVCQACHTVDEAGADKVGPNLFGLFGARAGQRAYSFERRHSTALKKSGVVWSDETLDRFLENPGEFIPGNRMPFVGMRKTADRDDVLAYLKSVTR
jgi:cytochrome c